MLGHHYDHAFVLKKLIVHVVILFLTGMIFILFLRKNYEQKIIMIAMANYAVAVFCAFISNEVNIVSPS